jgi:hypothetical protein
MVKAEELSNLLSDEEFVCCAGWIDSFKLCYNISCGKVSGEEWAVNCEVTAEWLNTAWSKMHELYPDSNIFNANEMGFFFRLTPERTLKFKGENVLVVSFWKIMSQFLSVPMKKRLRRESYL